MSIRLPGCGNLRPGVPASFIEFTLGHQPRRMSLLIGGTFTRLRAIRWCGQRCPALGRMRQFGLQKKPENRCRYASRCIDFELKRL